MGLLQVLFVSNWLQLVWIFSAFNMVFFVLSSKKGMQKLRFLQYLLV